MKAGAWSTAEHQRLAELFGKGYSDAEIGADLDRTERSIANKRHELKLRRYRRDTRRADGGATLAKQCEILTDAIETIRLLGRAEGWRDVIEECDRALKRAAAAER